MEKKEQQKYFRAISVVERLPKKPERITGGQQVSIVHRDYGIEKIVILSDGSLSIMGFHFINRKWYAEWNTRSAVVNESKHRDFTELVTHWLEDFDASQFKEQTEEVNIYMPETCTYCNADNIHKRDGSNLCFSCGKYQ